MPSHRLLFCLFLLAALTGITCAPQGEVPQKRVAVQPTEPEKIGDLGVPMPGKPASLKPRIDAALDNVAHRDLLTTHAFWTIIHGILGLGPDVMLVDPNTGKRIKALDFICNAGSVRGMEFTPQADGVDVVTMPGSGVGQGHQDQFITEMAQWSMPRERRFVVQGKEYAYGDFLRYAKDRARVNGNQELSWAILIIGQYFGTDLQWTNNAGEKLKFEDLLRYELAQPIDTAACGGTHRLFGLTWAYHLHRAKGGQKVGVWKDVADRIEHYKRLAHKYQNSDGAFSSNYVSKPGHSEDSQVRIATTGHVLEWLSLALTDQELTAPWVQEAANALALMILRHRSDPIDGGALYHAVHGLSMYRARVFNTSIPHLLMPPPPKD